MNAICPNVVRTGISTSTFYDSIEAQGLLVPMERVLGVFESLLGSEEKSGQIFEVGPKGVKIREEAEPMDEATRFCAGILTERAAPLHARVE